MAPSSLILDTHVLVWWQSGNPKLANAVRDVIADPDNRVFVSAASAWEIAVKTAKGRAPDGIGSAVHAIRANGFEPLAITAEHAERAGYLDWSHADPFDRLIVAQALHEGLILVHADDAIRAVPGLSQLWAR